MSKEQQPSDTQRSITLRGEEIRRFKMKGRMLPLIASMFAILFLLGFFIGVATGLIPTHDTPSNTVKMEIFLLCGTIYLALLTLNAFILTSDVLIDNTGIRWLIFGKERNKIAWADVKRIRVNNTPDFVNYRPPIEVYYIDKTLKFRLPYWKNSSIAFTARYDGIRDLLDIINIYIQRYNIPILDLRQKPVRSIPQL